MTAKLRYDDLLGPSVRIGILQNQEKIRATCKNEYRLVTKDGEIGRVQAGSDVACSIGKARPAELQYRIVLKKAFRAAEAEAISSPAKELEPLATISLGVEFGPDASAVEYWRCSRGYASEAEARRVRDTLAGSEKFSILPEVVTPAEGGVKVELADGKVVTVPEWLRIEPVEPETSRIVVHDVIVGIEYHWRHLERQRFRGVIEIRVDNTGQLTAISEVPVEAYLFSVNSSEMMSVMPEDLLKAQTVAARNTMFATMGKHHYADAFHLCSDDHCQCYRGSSRETPDSRRVTLATVGEVMISNGEICDARYSKMCGGFMEAFESVWNEEPRAYLPAGVDADKGSNAHALYPADTEDRAAALIKSKPDCFCNTTVGDVPPYLTYTAPYFRWTFRYTREEAEQLISRYLGKSIGELKELIPLKRGKSGRIEFLKIVASDGEWTIGKELQIRKALSPTCLYSTAFIVEHERNADGSLAAITLNGGGWGHGAGLCQIGATMMAYRGRGYKEILSHYYPNTKLVSLASDAASTNAESVIAFQESRLGERCYEYYNCYAVAKCPVYLEQVCLEATEEAGGKHVFSCSNALDAATIKCEFLTFEGNTAKAK